MSKAKVPTDGWGRFQPAANDVSDSYSLIWASQGIGGSGKTHFLLTAPEPIAVMLFDPDGITPLMRKDEFKHKDIRVIQYNFNPGRLSVTDRPKAAKDALDQFLEDYAVALRNARTIGWDKEDHIWEMLRYARLEAVTDKPASYYELNLEYRGWFHDAAEAGVNLGVIRGMKEKWGKTGVNRNTGQPTFGSLGEMEPRGQKEVNELVQVVLDHRWEDGEFRTRIHDKCRVGPATELIGKDFGSLDFETLALELYPETASMPGVWDKAAA